MAKTHTELRELFLSYFEEQGHRRLPSSSLIPQADPTLLFTNAGMVQFKPIFLGEETRPYLRATTCQKCMRAGGKHNDLDQVGYTARHHTFFEMLGNFSFGDYFKEGAILYAYEFLTRKLSLDPGRLWVTVFREDGEALTLWKKIGIPPERILKGDEKDNFWAMGDTGPCGPCSEIYYDQGEDPAWHCPDPLRCGPFCSCDRYLELWNLVFMEFNRSERGTLTPLPKPCIDTGMGLERLCAVVQGVKSNYDTDLFLPLREVLEATTAISYQPEREEGIAMRVLMDHARAVTFLIADGVLPGNEGRGYVLRRIMRRAIRFGYKLSPGKNLLAPLCARVIATMGTVYPELSQNEKVIHEVVALEEERFGETLSRGLRLFSDTVHHLKSRGEQRIPGEVAFRLYDTYGFPRDLIEVLAREENLTLDEEGFEEALSAQKTLARLSQKKTREKGAGPQVLALPPTEFLGYETLEGSGMVLWLSGKEELKEGEEGEIVLDRTPFYAEGGGQVADRGVIYREGTRLRVLDVQKTPQGIYLHRVRVEEGTVRPGDHLHLSVDREHRQGAAVHHTATHLLQAALRKILGTHVRQAGSLVEPRRLRFDFTHYQPLSLKEWRLVEDLVNEKIREALPVETAYMEYDQAIAKGALAFFGDKYGEIVRVVEIPGFSLELCGGTHVSHTGALGLWVIREEAGVASGIRRIEALSGITALNHLRELEQRLSRLAETLKAPVHELEQRLLALMKEREELEKTLAEQRKRALLSQVPTLLEKVQDLSSYRVLSERVRAESVEELRLLSDQLRSQVPELVILLGSEHQGKAFLFLSLPQGTPFHAGSLMKELARLFSGKGGGGERSAQAGGGNPAELSRALTRFSELLRAKSLLGS